MNVQHWEISAMLEAFLYMRNRMLDEISKTFWFQYLHCHIYLQQFCVAFFPCKSFRLTIEMEHPKYNFRENNLNTHYIGDFLNLLNIRVLWSLLNSFLSPAPRESDFPTILDKVFGFCSCNNVVKGPFQHSFPNSEVQRPFSLHCFFIP